MPYNYDDIKETYGCYGHIGKFFLKHKEELIAAVEHDCPYHFTNYSFDIRVWLCSDKHSKDLKINEVSYDSNNRKPQFMDLDDDVDTDDIKELLKLLERR